LPIWALLQSLRAITLQYIKSFESSSATETNVINRSLQTANKATNFLSINIQTNTANDTFLTHGFAQSQMLGSGASKRRQNDPITAVDARSTTKQIAQEHPTHEGKFYQ